MKKSNYTEQVLNKIFELLEKHPERWIYICEDKRSMGIYTNGLKRIFVHPSYIKFTYGNELVQIIGTASALDSFEDILNKLHSITSAALLIQNELPEGCQLFTIVNDTSKWESNLGLNMYRINPMLDLRFDKYSTPDHFEFFVGNKIFEVLPTRDWNLYQALSILYTTLEKQEKVYLQNSEAEVACSFLINE